MHVALFRDGVLEWKLDVRNRKQGQAVCEAWMLNVGKRTAYLKGIEKGHFTVIEAWPKEENTLEQ